MCPISIPTSCTFKKFKEIYKGNQYEYLSFYFLIPKCLTVKMKKKNLIHQVAFSGCNEQLGQKSRTILNFFFFVKVKHFEVKK